MVYKIKEVREFNQNCSPTGTPTLGAARAAAPSAPILGGQEGQELPFILNSFHLSYLLKGHFLALQTVCFK